MRRASEKLVVPFPGPLRVAEVELGSSTRSPAGSLGSAGPSGPRRARPCPAPSFPGPGSAAATRRRTCSRCRRPAGSRWLRGRTAIHRRGRSADAQGQVVVRQAALAARADRRRRPRGIGRRQAVRVLAQVVAEDEVDAVPADLGPDRVVGIGRGPDGQVDLSVTIRVADPRQRVAEVVPAGVARVPGRQTGRSGPECTDTAPIEVALFCPSPGIPMARSPRPSPSKSPADASAKPTEGPE